MELAIGLAVVATAGGLGALLRRRPAPREAPSPAFVSSEPTTRGLRSGDVLMAPGLELALSAMIELDEAGLVLRAFRTIEHEERWVVQLDPHGKRIALGTSTAEVPDGSVPEALPIGGRMVRLERRGSAVARSDGARSDGARSDGARSEGARSDGARSEGRSALVGRVRYAILSERAGRVVVVIDPDGGARIALRLDTLDIRSVDVLRGGDVKRTE